MTLKASIHRHCRWTYLWSGPVADDDESLVPFKSHGPLGKIEKYVQVS